MALLRCGGCGGFGKSVDGVDIGGGEKVSALFASL